MRPSHPTPLSTRNATVCCLQQHRPLSLCPKSPCQQIFRSSCQDLSVNKCVPIPGYSSGGWIRWCPRWRSRCPRHHRYWRSNRILVLARLKAKRRRIALHEDAMERREKVKNERRQRHFNSAGVQTEYRRSQLALCSVDETSGWRYRIYPSHGRFEQPR